MRLGLSAALMVQALFGGALEISLLDGAEYVDASQLRQVPDNQECFVSEADANRSIIVELLELQEGPDEPAESHGILGHWRELAEANDAESAQVVKSVALDPLPDMERSVVYGVQVIPKYGKAHDLHRVPVWLGLLRIPRVRTDVLVSHCGGAAGEADEGRFVAMLESVRILDWTLFK